MLLESASYASVAPIREESVAPVDTLKEMAEFVFTAKYARYDEEKKRRESWVEAISRVEAMHLKKFHYLDNESIDKIKWAFDFVRNKYVVPSMRSIQFGGKAIESHHEKLYNCSVVHVTTIRTFAEILYLLLNGCGVGYSVQKQFIDRLPNLVTAADKTGSVVVYPIEDTIEGWADSIEALLSCYFKNTAFSGKKIVFDYSRIRPEGSPLKTSGGKAPGYKGLKAAHIKIKHLLDDAIENHNQKRLTSLNINDIICHCSDAVLSGGVRRSATICIFDRTDKLMLNAKTGEWFKTNPQRGRSNNTCVVNRNTVTLQEIKDILDQTRNFGEPGFLFVDDNHDGTIINPCGEIAFQPITKDGRSGVQFCNLTTINGKMTNTPAKFYEAVEAATIIGTLQAAYTDFPYLSLAAKELTEEEALLGVSITGMMEHPSVLLNENVQHIGAKLAVEVNRQWAKKIGINQAARITTIKPAGNSTVLFESLSSGIHPAHARKFLRRVQMNTKDPVYQYFKKHIPQACERSVNSTNGTDDVVTFPIEVSEEAILKKDLTAVQHLDIVKSTQKNWVLPGTTEANKKPIHHSISCTVLVKDNEWDEVAEYLFNNLQYFTAVSFLPDSGDKIYQQAPFEAVKTEEDELRFQNLKKAFKRIDYSAMKEYTDNTELQQEVACSGGACLI